MDVDETWHTGQSLEVVNIPARQPLERSIVLQLQKFVIENSIGVILQHSDQIKMQCNATALRIRFYRG